MKKIDISTKKHPNIFVMVDDEDFKWLNQWKWYMGSHGYACRRLWIKKEKRYETILLHRIVNKTSEGFLTDHRNMNRLDCTKKNLRMGDKSLNSINRGLQSNNTSGHRGVSWDKKSKKWSVSIKKNNLKIHLGYFINIKDAIITRKKGEEKYHAI